jgi:hypothetical protein
MRRYQQRQDVASRRTHQMTQSRHDQAATDERGRPRGTSRWGLYLPFVLLVLVIGGWSAFWHVARGLVGSGLDSVIADARQRGDSWTCVNRRISGYPFRLEVRCDDVTLVRSQRVGVVTLSTGPVVIIGQPHTPSHLIAQADGPLRGVMADGSRFEARWDLAEASRRTEAGALERLSLDMRKPVVTITGREAAVSTIAAATLEAHLRRNPTRPDADMARDLFMRVGQIVSGDLDAVLGDSNPSDLDVQLTTSQANIFDHGLTPATLEAWRQASGRIDVSRIALKKGVKQIEAKGTLELDDARRPAGRIEPSAANIDQFFGIRLRGGAMDLASALSGRAAAPGADGLRPLPSLTISNGRISLGPIRLPLAALQPLY